MRIIAAMLFIAVIGGACGGNRDEFMQACAAGNAKLGNPAIDQYQKMAIFEMMRNAGCFGRTPPQQMNIRIM